MSLWSLQQSRVPSRASSLAAAGAGTAQQAQHCMATPDGHSQAVTGRGHQRGQLILDTTRSCYLLHFFQQKTGSKLMWMQTCKHAVCSCSGLRGNSFMQGAPGPPPPKNTSTSSTASAVPWGHRRHPQQPQPSVKASQPHHLPGPEQVLTEHESLGQVQHRATAH